MYTNVYFEFRQIFKRCCGNCKMVVGTFPLGSLCQTKVNQVLCNQAGSPWSFAEQGDDRQGIGARY